MPSLNALANLLKDPGRFSRTHKTRRKVYKLISGELTHLRRLRRSAAAKSLPPPKPALRIADDQGFTRVSAEHAAQLTQASQVLSSCRSIVASGKSFSRSKAYLQQMITDDELHQYPEFFALALDPDVLSAVTEYLGELPVLTSIKLLHSPPDVVDPSGSQLYHCDFDDDRQLKMFFNVSDVGADCGPLTVLPAAVSETVRKRLGYSFGGNLGHVPDAQIRDAQVEASEVPLVGEAGSLCFVDTSRCFHFGSRVAARDRYVFYLQYVTLTNFLFHPAPHLLPGRLAAGAKRFPYSSHVRAGMSPVQKLVLSGAASA